MPERRGHKRSSRSRGGRGIAAAIGLRLWATVADHPIDSAAILCSSAASLIIIVNAIFLQSGQHPAPFFANPTAQAADNRPTATIPPPPLPPPWPADKLVDAAPARTAPVVRTSQAASAHRNDPIGDLIGTSITSPARIAAVQRALSDFGYGQLRASGTLDEPTGAAITKFEIEHKLPVTGRLSDRLLSELAALTGHSIP